MEYCVRHKEYQDNPQARYCGNCGAILQRGNSDLEKTLQNNSVTQDIKDNLIGLAKIAGIVAVGSGVILGTAYSIEFVMSFFN